MKLRSGEAPAGPLKPGGPPKGGIKNGLKGVVGGAPKAPKAPGCPEDWAASAAMKPASGLFMSN